MFCSIVPARMITAARLGYDTVEIMKSMDWILPLKGGMKNQPRGRVLR